MNDKRRTGADPYGDLSKRTGGSGPSPTLIVGGVVAAVVVLVGILAVVLTGGEADTDAVQEVAPVQATGEFLATYPESASLAADPASDPAVGSTPPVLEGQTFDGTDVTVDPADGSQVVIFAAHWCPHCQKEIPLIQEWIDDGNLPEGVEVNLVSTAARAGQSEYPPSEWLDSEGWTGPVLLDDADQTASQAWGLTGFPYMVFIDGDGQVVQRASGELPIDQFEQFVDQIAP